jgi:hypothetical protein
VTVLAYVSAAVLTWFSVRSAARAGAKRAAASRRAVIRAVTTIGALAIRVIVFDLLTFMTVPPFLLQAYEDEHEARADFQ